MDEETWSVHEDALSEGGSPPGGSEAGDDELLPQELSVVPPNVPQRPSWDFYFLNIASAVSIRADCSRRKVGAVVVQDNRLQGAGYNGSPPGGPSCLAGECPRAESGVEPGSSYDTGIGSCIAVHAELNAILDAGGRPGCIGGTLYTTDYPCGGCHKLLRAVGIATVVWYDVRRNLILKEEL